MPVSSQSRPPSHQRVWWPAPAHNWAVQTLAGTANILRTGATAAVRSPGRSLRSARLAQTSAWLWRLPAWLAWLRLCVTTRPLSLGTPHHGCLQTRLALQQNSGQSFVSCVQFSSTGQARYLFPAIASTHNTDVALCRCPCRPHHPPLLALPHLPPQARPLRPER